MALAGAGMNVTLGEPISSALISLVSNLSKSSCIYSPWSFKLFSPPVSYLPGLQLF